MRLAPRPAAAGGWQSRPPLSRTAIARLVQAAGALDLATALLPPAHGRIAALSHVVPVTGMLTARAAVSAAGLLLIYLGAGLRRGKHRAWQVAVALTGASVLLHLLRDLDVEAAGVATALLVLLVTTRHRFHAVADPRSPGRALVALVGFAAAGFLVGFVEIAVRVNRLVGDPPWTQWAQHAALGLIGVTGPVQFRYRLGDEAVSLTTGGFGLLAVAVALVLLLRPGAARVPRTVDDEARLRALLTRYGSADSLGYFALRPDKSLLFAPDGKAVIAYRVLHGVSLAAGDPIGDPAAWPAAIDGWLADCTRYGWTPAVLGCGGAGGRAYRRSGLDVVELGDEAVVDAAAFSLAGRPMRSVRQAVARMERAGYRCEIARRADLTPDAVAAAEQAVTQFREGGVERGFSMALCRLADPSDGDCLIVLCRDDAGRVRGLLQFVPWGPDGLSLDLMRGDRTAGNGLVELMVVSVLRQAADLGVRRVSLNFAVLRGVFARAEDLGAGPVLRLWHRVLQVASRFWQIESLYRANAKYQPNWLPRYLCFPTARDLPRIAIAALEAEAFLALGWRRPAPDSAGVPVPPTAPASPLPSVSLTHPARPTPAGDLVTPARR